MAESVKAAKKQKKEKVKKGKRERPAAADGEHVAAPAVDLGALLLSGSAKSFDDAGLGSLFDTSKV